MLYKVKCGRCPLPQTLQKLLLILNTGWHSPLAVHNNDPYQVCWVGKGKGEATTKEVLDFEWLHYCIDTPIPTPTGPCSLSCEGLVNYTASTHGYI